ncbi:MAG: FG-GAP-like repeat-containing protein [bacterium]
MCILSLFKKRVILFYLIVFAFVTYTQPPAFTQDNASPAAGDTIKLIHYPERLNVGQALSVEGRHIWLITVEHRLYKWNHNRFDDVTAPNEEYYLIFAAAPDDIWLHSYNQGAHRYQFKKIFQDAIYMDPDNFRLSSVWSNTPKDIWGGGIVGTLLHFDGQKWRRRAGMTNNHIMNICIDKDARGWVVIETGGGLLELYKVSLSENLFQRIKRLPNENAFVANGIWEIYEDRLVFYSWTGEVRTYSVPRKNEPENVVPFQTDAIIYDKAGIWHVKKTGHPGFVLLKDTQDTVLKLSEDGQLSRLPTRVVNESLSVQFYRRKQLWEQEYTAGCGFLDDDENLDIYTIRPVSKNILILKKKIRDDDQPESYNFQDYTVQYNAVENQSTTDNKVYYDNGILIADLNNDGDEDLFITAHQGSNLYFENEKHSSFTDKTAAANLFDENHRWNMAAAGDVDNDGDLDVFVTREYSSNVLYVNNGFGRFKEVTKRAHLQSKRGGMGCVFGDIDGDGDTDLFVANWRTQNRLYRNDSVPGSSTIPVFTDVSDSAGVGLNAVKRSSSAMFGDVDNDNDLDLFVVNRSESGRLYVNDGAGVFEDVTIESGLFKQNVFCEGGVFFDADNDGDLDLAVSCKRQGLFYRNTGRGQFIEESEICGFAVQTNTASMISGDFDNDGDIDLYATSPEKSSYLYDNHQNDRRFIKFTLQGGVSNRGAVGSKVYFYQGGNLGDPNSSLGMRVVEAGSGLASTNSKVVHFGTGNHRSVDCKIVFPSGITLERENILPGSILTINEVSGSGKFWVHIKHLIEGLPGNSEFRAELAAYLGIFALIVLVFPNITKASWASLSWASLLPLAMILLVRFSLQNQSLGNRLIGSCAVGVFTFILVAQFRFQRFYREQQDELTDRLWQELNRFQHGDWARSNLNQLLFFAQNINHRNQASAKLRQNLLEDINSYIKLTYPSLLTISKVGQRSHECKNEAESVGRAASNVYRHVEAIKNKLQLADPLPLKKFEQMVDPLLTLKAALDLLTRQVEKKYKCSIRDHLETVQRSFADSQLFSIQCDLDSIPRVNVRIRSADLTPALHNLIQNAKTAAEGRPSPQLKIYGEQKDNRLRLHFVDNGKGIPKDKHVKIFQAGFTTSSKRGKGMGLAFSKQTLNKYDGDIYVVHSSPGVGSDFVIELVIL